MEIDEDIGQLILKVHEPTIHLYQPLGRSKTKGTVLICPGGGYYLQAWDWEGTDFAQFFNHHGITAAVLRYRLPYWEREACRSEVALTDVQRAVQMLRARADEFDIDPNQIALMGFSAGGHLAASGAVHPLAADSLSADTLLRFSSKPDLSILVYPVISMDTIKAGHGGTFRSLLGTNPAPEKIAYYSLEKQVTNTVPPTFIAHATDDEAVVPDNSILYYQALRSKGIPAALHIYSGGGHGFGTARPLNNDTAGWLADLLSWLANYW